MISLPNASQPPRIGILSLRGSLLLLEISGFSDRSPGTMTIISDLSTDLTQRNLDLPGFDVIASSPDALYQPSQALSCCNCTSKHLVIIGLDGAARVFLPESMIGLGDRCVAFNYCFQFSSFSFDPVFFIFRV